MKHLVQGGQCVGCVKLYDDCRMLDFSRMPVVRIENEKEIIVRCTSYEHPRKREAIGN